MTVTARTWHVFLDKMLTPCLWNHSLLSCHDQNYLQLAFASQRYFALGDACLTHSAPRWWPFQDKHEPKVVASTLGRALCCMSVRLSLNLVAQYLLKHGDEEFSAAQFRKKNLCAEAHQQVHQCNQARNALPLFGAVRVGSHSTEAPGIEKFRLAYRPILNIRHQAAAYTFGPHFLWTPRRSHALVGSEAFSASGTRSLSTFSLLQTLLRMSEDPRLNQPAIPHWFQSTSPSKMVCCIFSPG